MTNVTTNAALIEEVELMPWLDARFLFSRVFGHSVTLTNGDGDINIWCETAEAAADIARNAIKTLRVFPSHYAGSKLVSLPESIVRKNA